MPNSPYDVESQSLPYGSVGGAGIRSLQSEMLRRAQMEQMAQQEALKQAQLQLQNERQARQDAITQQVALENVASNKAAREAEVAARDQTTHAAQQKEFTGMLAPGDELSPEQQQTGQTLGLGPLMVSKTTAATNGLPGTVFNMADGNPVKAPDVTKTTFRGTPAQRDEEEQRKAMGALLDGTTHVDRSDPLQMEALWHQMGGKGALPAGVVVPKPSAAETKSAHELKMMGLKAKMENGYKPTPEETADLKVFDEYNQTTAQKDAEARQHINMTITAAGDRQQSGFVNGAVEHFKTRLASENKDLEKDLERVDRATTMLARPSFVADAVAAPEFLQIVAGGMGSGLRMTDAELRRVNEAQSWLEQKRAQLAKLPGSSLVGIDQTTIGQEMRAKMQEILQDVQAARKRKAMAEENAMLKVGNAKSVEEATQIEADYWKNKREGAKMNQPSTSKPAAAKAPAGYTLDIQ